jgi:hypothetical protein
VVLFFKLFIFKSFQEYVNQWLPAQRPTDGTFGKQTVLKSYAQFQRFQDLDELIPPAHAEPLVASSSIFVPASDLIVNLLTRLADYLIRGFSICG